MSTPNIEVKTITLPVYWASALVNGDYSGLDEAEAARCRAEADFMAAQGCHVVNIQEGTQRFTWHYDLYDGGASGVSGGEVADYIVYKARSN